MVLLMVRVNKATEDKPDMGDQDVSNSFTESNVCVSPSTMLLVGSSGMLLSNVGLVLLELAIEMLGSVVPKTGEGVIREEVEVIVEVEVEVEEE